MSNPFDDDAAPFVAVVNDEGQYALWPAHAAVPGGWSIALGPASRRECLDGVAALWTDMRPRSLAAVAP